MHPYEVANSLSVVDMSENMTRCSLFSSSFAPIDPGLHVEKGTLKDRAAAAAEGYSPYFIAFIANKRRPSCSATFSFYQSVGGAIVVVVNKYGLLLKWIFDGAARATVDHVS